MKILSLENDRINKEKYDQCIDESPFGTICALSWYLDIVSPGWKLLATPDYSYVMPLPIRRKIGIIPYLIQPPLSQQFGLFSVEEISFEIMESFLRKVRFPYALLQFNPGNTFAIKTLKLRPNYLLYLDKPYEDLKKAYRRDSAQMLEKAISSGLLYEKELSEEDCLHFIQTHSTYYKGRVFLKLKKLLDVASEQNRMILRAVYNNTSQKILGIAVFLQYKNRYYFLCSVSSLAGKRLRVLHFLLDHFIEEHAETPMTLDFKGSSVSSVALLYESFGSVFENYPRYFVNYLPSLNLRN